MTYSFYDGTIPVLKSILTSLKNVLNKAQERPDYESLVQARLYEDMKPLESQIRIATQFSENLIAKLTAREAVVFEDNLTSFAQFHERIDKVLQSLKGIDKDFVNKQAEVSGPVQLGPAKSADMTNAAYAHGICLPNIYFHLTTAYGILRKEGVPLGKMDYFIGFAEFMIPQAAGKY
ncbi:hypothetical protein N7468_005381 [Penicillium chermesinum]|uniref:Uncharacterized protein n=1 Tax=Penicillium chermesinum TaxID=63820 RepID=A0A9W9NZQ0_9EURO|nr:uncharacterized protein N7468_005381 [Penicillium chermesinum]KAJ5232425.1 hypothetical protein N7468_005381 [Penicillium chermesinum]KAJ6172084.1 hypothetical protein N7470_001151 [Penicillium chermesinum]